MQDWTKTELQTVIVVYGSLKSSFFSREWSVAEESANGEVKLAGEIDGN